MLGMGLRKQKRGSPACRPWEVNRVEQAVESRPALALCDRLGAELDSVRVRSDGYWECNPAGICLPICNDDCDAALDCVAHDQWTEPCSGP